MKHPTPVTKGARKADNSWRTRARIHGCRRGTHTTKEYRAWINMRQRCSNPNVTQFSDYGGRGIRVCKRWQTSFVAFLSDMGLCPAGCTIERKDNNGNYEPNNCRWGAQLEQANNRRSNRILALNGCTHTMADWSRQLGISYFVIRSRLRYGWSVKDALTLPSSTRKRYWKGVRRA